MLLQEKYFKIVRQFLAYMGVNGLTWWVHYAWIIELTFLKCVLCNDLI